MTTTRGASLGNISLAGAIAGLLATEMALRHGVVAGASWHVIRQAFEAATIGGFADWFAVSALFHEVPLPVIRRHTNIIVKNRRRIIESIADLLTMRTTQRWVFEQDKKLGALVFVRANRIATAHQIVFQVHPDFRGHVEDDLIAFALQQLSALPAHPVRVAATNAYAELVTALEQQGFRFVNGLTLMEMKTE